VPFQTDFDPGPAQFYLFAPNNYYEAFFAKYDTHGNFLCAGNIGGPDSEVANSIVADNSNNIYLAGNFTGATNFSLNNASNFLTTSGSSDIFVCKIKIDCKSFITAQVEDSSGQEWKIYPNPTSRYVYFELNEKNLQDMKVCVRDIYGNDTKFSSVKDQPVANSLVMDLALLAEGIYFIEIRTKKSIIKQKIVIER
jgi:hypothetical protein